MYFLLNCVCHRKVSIGRGKLGQYQVKFGKMNFSDHLSYFRHSEQLVDFDKYLMNPPSFPLSSLSDTYWYMVSCVCVC